MVTWLRRGVETRPGGIPTDDAWSRRFFGSTRLRRTHRTRAFSLIELLVVIAVIALLISLLVPALSGARRASMESQCMNNMRQFAAADTLYLNDHAQFPLMSDFVPSSISVERLRQIGAYFNMSVPEGEAKQWPKRPDQPKWINCPFARNSGYAEGVTVGGGLYTGYVYLGGLEESSMVRNQLAVLVNKGHAADRRGSNRGVLWSDILSEFPTSEPRRFENFHTTSHAGRYADFRFHANEIEGINRAWSDGSVDWKQAAKLQIGNDDSPDLRIRHVLGNYYF